MPADLAHQITHFTQAMQSTKVCEDAFNIIRDSERSSKSGICERRRAWHTVRVNTLAEDTDRPQVTITPAARHSASKAGSSTPLPKSLFHPKVSEFSLGEQSLDSLCSQRDWPSVPAPVFPMIGVCTRALEESGGQERVLRHMWLCMLFVPGTAACHIKSKALYLVLKPTVSGVLLWPLQHQPSGGFMLVSSAAEPSVKRWTQVSAACIDEWKAINIEVLAPCQLPAGSATSSGGMEIGLRVGGHAQALVEFSAKRAFPGMTTPILSKLHSFLEVAHKGARPSSEIGLMRALLSHLFPKASDSEIAAIMALRRTKLVQEASSSILLNHQNLQMTKHLIDDEVVDDIVKYQKASGCEPKPRKSPAQASSSGDGIAPITGNASSAALKGQDKPRLSFKGYHTPESAKDLIPKVSGCWLKRDDVRFFRWSGRYPTPPGQQSHWTKCWSQAFSEEKALRFVLQKIWSAHQDATGDEIPFDLSDEPAA